jgi:serine/threonine protein kinase/tetratricopeptide (TPR) repeat protein
MELPCRFGKYELIEKLATGGMAEVFLARSFGLQGFQKRLVIKRILPALANEPRFVSMFIKEAKITAGLTHPNIVQIFELGRVSSDHYIAMEFIHGRDLARITRQLRRTGKSLPYPLAVYVIANLMRGLAYAHSLTDASGTPLRLVHRDISPHNVLVSFQGEVKLLDFGIARLATAEEQRRTGLVGGGKYAYMSPEQASGGALDARSDLFSAGIVLYELLSGSRLFQHPDPEEKLRLVREAVVPDIRERNDNVPEALWTIVQRLLTRDPDDRYTRAEHVEEDLWAFLFSKGWRADAAGLSNFMGDLFPAVAEASPARVDLAGLADDLGRIDDSSGETGSLQSSRTHSGSSLSGVTRAPPPLKPGERRTVSVLVAELCGLTALSEVQDPSQIVRHHYQILRRIRRIVDRYDGFLESFRDESLVIFFGMRKTRESDLERALSCALRLQNARNLGVSLALGVHVGEITVGSRSGRSWRYLAHGDTMKLARRLCMEANLSEILVSPSATELVEGLYRFAGGPSFRMKGQETEVESMRLRRKRRRPDGGSGRWVRRGDELDILADGLRRLQAGQGGLITIVGEGGVGKSRLLGEVERLARSRSVPFFSSRALAYGQDTPLAPFRDLVSSVIGAEPDDTKGKLRTRLKRLSQLRIDNTDRQIIGQLFGFRTRRRFEPHDVRRASAVLVQRLSEDQPVIFAMDDAHNLSPQAAALIAHVIAQGADSSVLFLISARSPMPSPFTSAQHSIQLSPLAPAQQYQMATDLLSVQSLAPALAEKLTEASRGNPQYLSMVLRSLLRDDRLKRDGVTALLQDELQPLSLPPGMDGLIAARIDQLGEPSRRFLQIAALVGVDFSVSLVAEACRMEADSVAGVVARLSQQGLVSTGVDGWAAFSSPLVWEVVRRAIVANRLRQYHGLIAEGIESLHVDDLDVHRSALARHCAAAGRLVDAVRHAMHIGNQHRSKNLLAEAATQYQLGIRWLEEAVAAGLGTATYHMLCGPLWLDYGEVCVFQGHFDAAARWLLLAQEHGSDLGETDLEARASLMLGRMYRDQGRHEQAKAYLDAALRASFASTMPAPEGPVAWRTHIAVRALELLGKMEQDQGATAAAAQRFQLAFRIAGDDDGLVARAMMGIATRHIRAGETPEALEILEGARTRAERTTDRILLGRVINAIGIAHYYAADYEAALAQFRASVEVRQGINYRSGVVINYHNIGDAYLRMGDLGRAWAAFQQSRDLARAMGWTNGETMNAPFVAFIEGLPKEDSAELVSDEPAALSRMRAAAEEIKDLTDIELEVSAQWLLGRLLAAHGEQDAARAQLNGALDTAREIDARPLIRDVTASLEALPSM